MVARDKWEHLRIKRLSQVIKTYPTKKYLHYLMSPQWQTRRREHLDRYPTCQIDGFRRAIQVHHWTYKRLGRELTEDLCSVCLLCHKELHCMTIPDPSNDNQLELPLHQLIKKRS